METEIELKENDNLDSVVYTLLAANARGEHVFAVFAGHELHSANLTMDSAYIEVTGYPKTEYVQMMKERNDEFTKREQARMFSEQAKEQKYAEKVNASRIYRKAPITSEKVIRGLKFIVGHPEMEQEELIDGLLRLGCNFSLDDIYQQFPKINEISLSDAIISGYIPTGAELIVRMRDGENARNLIKKSLFAVDDEVSIYNFIRVATGDKTYTKESIDVLISGAGKHKLNK